MNDFTSLSEESNRRINTLAFSINKQRALQLHPSKQSKSLPNTPLHAPKKVNFNYSQSVQSVSRPSNISSQIKKENKVLDLKEAIRINFINKLVQQSKKPSVGDAMKKYIKYGIPNQELDDLRRHPELSALVHPIRKKSKQVGERRRSIKDFIQPQRTHTHRSKMEVEDCLFDALVFSGEAFLYRMFKFVYVLLCFFSP